MDDDWTSANIPDEEELMAMMDSALSLAEGMTGGRRRVDVRGVGFELSRGESLVEGFSHTGPITGQVITRIPKPPLQRREFTDILQRFSDDTGPGISEYENDAIVRVIEHMLLDRAVLMGLGCREHPVMASAINTLDLAIVGFGKMTNGSARHDS